MATLFDDAEIRIADDPRRWLWLAMVALLGVLACTAVLGVVLAPRWPDAWSISQLTQRRASTAASVMPSNASPASNVASSGAKSGDLYAPAIKRPMAYSSVDTRTLETARAHEDMLAGKRTPVDVVIEDVPVPQAVVAPPPINPSIARSRVAAQASERPPPAVAPAPRPTTPPRMEVARRTPAVEVARRPSPDVALHSDERRTPARSIGPLHRDAERAHIAAREPQRPAPSSGESPPPRWVPYRQESPAYDRRNAPTVVDRQDAAALDDRWQRRELWFRERLQGR